MNEAPNPRTPAQIKLHYDSVVASANRAHAPQTDTEKDIPFLGLILLIILALATIGGILAFVITNKPG